MSTVAMAADIMSMIGVGTSIVKSGIDLHEARQAEHEQKKGQREALAKQEEADRKAETERLQALAKNQESEAGFDFGVDSALAKRYADAAQKWGAGTGSMNQEEEDNPFYMKGLV